MRIKAIKTKIFCPGQDLLTFLGKHIKFLEEGDVLVITSKIIAVAQKRLIANFSPRQKNKIIKQESDAWLVSGRRYLTMKDGAVMTGAGVDESNGNGDLILLPSQPERSARDIRRYLVLKFGLKNLGVIVTDSRSGPLRAGAQGRALAYSGLRGLKKYRGTVDIFGRKFKSTRVNVVDSLAAAAVLCMGEGRELSPLAIIKGAPAEFISRADKEKLDIKPSQDIYAPVFRCSRFG